MPNNQNKYLEKCAALFESREYLKNIEKSKSKADREHMHDYLAHYHHGSNNVKDSLKLVGKGMAGAGGGVLGAVAGSAVGHRLGGSVGTIAGAVAGGLAGMYPGARAADRQAHHYALSRLNAHKE